MSQACGGKKYSANHLLEIHASTRSLLKRGEQHYINAINSNNNLLQSTNKTNTMKKRPLTR